MRLSRANFGRGLRPSPNACGPIQRVIGGRPKLASTTIENGWCNVESWPTACNPNGVTRTTAIASYECHLKIGTSYFPLRRCSNRLLRRLVGESGNLLGVKYIGCSIDVAFMTTQSCKFILAIQDFILIL